MDRHLTVILAAWVCHWRQWSLIVHQRQRKSHRPRAAHQVWHGSWRKKNGTSSNANITAC